MLRDLSRDMDNFTSQAETFIKETSRTTKKKVMDKCFGLTDPFIKGNGKAEYKMEKDRSI
jgi:hypothetical protein